MYPSQTRSEPSLLAGRLAGRWVRRVTGASAAGLFRDVCLAARAPVVVVNGETPDACANSTGGTERCPPGGRPAVRPIPVAVDQQIARIVGWTGCIDAFSAAPRPAIKLLRRQSEPGRGLSSLLHSSLGAFRRLLERASFWGLGTGVLFADLAGGDPKMSAHGGGKPNVNNNSFAFPGDYWYVRGGTRLSGRQGRAPTASL